MSAWFRRRRYSPSRPVFVALDEPFGTVGTLDDLADEFRRTYANRERQLFAGGPSVWLIGLGSVATNPWFIEPSLRGRYVKRCNARRGARGRALPTPLDVEDARRVAWASVTVFGDGWPDFVLERHETLGPVAYQQHAALVLDAHGLSVAELVELRSRPCRSGWSFDTDPDYRQLYSLPNDGRNKR